MDPRELLIDTYPYIPPARALDGLDTGDAERKMADVPHSIAELVAHMTFWMEWFKARTAGREEPMATSAATGWPPVAQGSWPRVRQQFLDGLELLASLRDGALDEPITPAIEFPPLAHYTVRDALVHVATHNAHHLGQVIVVRQLIKCWPPPSGSWTW
jgi:uncharacterized damage-inducible protein DinB